VLLDELHLLKYQMVFEKCAPLQALSFSTDKYSVRIVSDPLVRFILAMKPQCLNIIAPYFFYHIVDENFIIQFASLSSQLNYSMMIKTSTANNFSPSRNILPALSRFSSLDISLLILNVDWLILLFQV
ncbi:hypothetical protein PFISCL1PPCAC_2707, partial [Pristionchus fissidentatus]